MFTFHFFVGLVSGASFQFSQNGKKRKAEQTKIKLFYKLRIFIKKGAFCYRKRTFY